MAESLSGRDKIRGDCAFTVEDRVCVAYFRRQGCRRSSAAASASVLFKMSTLRLTSLFELTTSDYEGIQFTATGSGSLFQVTVSPFALDATSPVMWPLTLYTDLPGNRAQRLETGIPLARCPASGLVRSRWFLLPVQTHHHGGRRLPG